ncbi:ABC transporter permease subunit [Lederbergia citrea]|uniref:Sugar ABC transporter permease n=1 Tax=Lederbergia citrea TaxID=2833581 RepID=A0A942Z5S3_9BACI|nr:sugar ABC transporter permease [Lederbergia citrea]MBS4204903.1 sugar ABC transporter permease [Lederbergia citrea]MBS4223246.1 sugar ABC transporter permease [Lederbergia citrea]
MDTVTVVKPVEEAKKKSQTLIQNNLKKMKRHWQLYFLVLPPVLYFLIFKYIPMANSVIAFKDYSVVQGIWGSPWAGWRHFELFFNNPQFWTLVKNTFFLSVYALLVGFPIPIILALCLNEVRNGIFKRSVQMITYAPYFISTVIIVSMIMLFFSPRLGIATQFLELVGLDAQNILGSPSAFRHIYVWSDVWQSAGYSAIIYLAALAGVSPELYEAAKVDGASRLQRIIYIDIPSILPVAVIILILGVGNIMAIGFEKVYLLQNPLNLPTSEIIATYVYKIGLLNANFSFATAVGLFNSIINLILLVVVNSIARKVSNNSLW